MSDEEDADDPFETFESDVEDREGDPFERLDDVEADEQGPDEPPASDPGDFEWDREESTGGDPASGYDAHDVTPGGHRDELDGSPDSPQGSDAPGGDPDESAADPFADSPFEYREEPDVRRGADPDPEPAAPDEAPEDRRGDPFEEDGVFEEMGVDDLDPDRVWEQLTDAEARGSVSKMRERTYAEVSKHSYCEQCEFFSAPPDVACSHEGTEILEFVDMETVRVVDCPVVAERKELEQE